MFSGRLPDKSHECCGRNFLPTMINPMCFPLPFMCTVIDVISVILKSLWWADEVSDWSRRSHIDSIMSNFTNYLWQQEWTIAAHSFKATNSTCRLVCHVSLFWMKYNSRILSGDINLNNSQLKINVLHYIYFVFDKSSVIRKCISYPLSSSPLFTTIINIINYIGISVICMIIINAMTLSVS